jgi:hypothetical protein
MMDTNLKRFTWALKSLRERDERLAAIARFNPSDPARRMARKLGAMVYTQFGIAPEIGYDIAGSALQSDDFRASARHQASAHFNDLELVNRIVRAMEVARHG